MLQIITEQSNVELPELVSSIPWNNNVVFKHTKKHIVLCSDKKRIPVTALALKRVSPQYFDIPYEEYEYAILKKGGMEILVDRLPSGVDQCFRDSGLRVKKRITYSEGYNKSSSLIPGTPVSKILLSAKVLQELKEISDISIYGFYIGVLNKFGYSAKPGDSLERIMELMGNLFRKNLVHVQFISSGFPFINKVTWKYSDYDYMNKRAILLFEVQDQTLLSLDEKSKETRTDWVVTTKNNKLVILQYDDKYYEIDEVQDINDYKKGYKETEHVEYDYEEHLQIQSSLSNQTLYNLGVLNKIAYQISLIEPDGITPYRKIMSKLLK